VAGLTLVSVIVGRYFRPGIHLIPSRYAREITSWTPGPSAGVNHRTSRPMTSSPFWRLMRAMAPVCLRGAFVQNHSEAVAAVGGQIHHGVEAAEVAGPAACGEVQSRLFDQSRGHAVLVQGDRGRGLRQVHGGGLGHVADFGEGPGSWGGRPPYRRGVRHCRESVVDGMTRGWARRPGGR
jgi:hypothetical protein